MKIHAGTLGTLLREVGLLSERPRPGVCAGQNINRIFQPPSIQNLIEGCSVANKLVCLLRSDFICIESGYVEPVIEYIFVSKPIC